jgi:hypothetical protein
MNSRTQALENAAIRISTRGCWSFLSSRVLKFLIACLAITICLFVLARVSVQPTGRSDDLPDHTHYRLSLRGTGC